MQINNTFEIITGSSPHLYEQLVGRGSELIHSLVEDLDVFRLPSSQRRVDAEHTAVKRLSRKLENLDCQPVYVVKRLKRGKDSGNGEQL